MVYREVFVRKNGIKSYVLFVLSFVLIFSMNLTSYANSSGENKTIRIEVSALNVRTSPWGSIIDVVTDGDTFTVYDSKKDSSGDVWYKIKSGSNYGYVYAGNGYTKVISTGSDSETNVDKRVRIEVSALNVRTSPWGSVLGLVTKGSTYQVYASKNDSSGNEWYKIKTGSNYGYIYAGDGYTKVISTGSDSDTKEDKKVQIEVSALNVRTSPWGSVLGVVTDGSTYQVYASTKDSSGNEWYKIKFGSDYGYIYAGNGYTKEVKKQETKKSTETTIDKRVRIEVSGLNVRTSPWGSIINVVTYGEVYNVNASTKDSDGNEWYKIKTGSSYGYIYAGSGYTKEVAKQDSSSNDPSGFTPRFSAPSTESKYYTTDNVFYQNGYGMPNCTCYAWGRAYEILGYKPTWLSRWDAYTFYDDNHENFPYGRGQEIRVGAIACWGGNGYGSAGHVAVVEKIYPDGRVTISESSYSGDYFRSDTYDSAEDLENAMGGNFKGYIYLR